MPSRLPVARSRSPALRYGAALGMLAVAAASTWAIAPVRDRTPYMFFFAAVTAAAAFGGIGPAVLTVVASVLLVDTAFLRGSDGLVAGLPNDAGFVLVTAVIIFLTHRAARSARAERAQREWSEVTLKSVGDGVIVTDASGRVLMMNAVAAQLTGWDEREALEQPIATCFHIVNERTRALVENPVDRVFREGKVVGLANHTVLISRDGREVPIDDSGAPIWSEDGRVVGAVLVFRDISERYAVERQRASLLEAERQARAEAEAANRSKDEFLAILSHELRTPLNAILGWAQVMQSGGGLSPEVRRGVEVIERNARRQSGLIEDVLDVSRIVSGKLSLESAPVHLGDVVGSAVDALRPLIGAKGLHLDVRGDCGGPVVGDAHRLQQVVTNLLSNAIKFTPRDGSIEVVMAREEPLCSIAVHDSGIGISPDFLPHVFDRFRQEDTGTARRFGGLGLGLPLVRHLVEMHGGSVSAASGGPGKGATFTVRLPLASATCAAQSREHQPRLADAPRLEGIRVLVVDDEEDARELLQTVLEQGGAEVEAAASVEDALRVLERIRPDVLLADLEMPEADGFELLRRLRERGCSAPAIAITAHTSIQDRIRVMSAGFRHHLAKPVDAAELLLVIASTRAPL